MQGCRKEMHPRAARPVSAAGQPRDRRSPAAPAAQRGGSGGGQCGCGACWYGGNVRSAAARVNVRVPCSLLSLHCCELGVRDAGGWRLEPPATRLAAAASTCFPAPSSAELLPLCVPLPALAPCLR